MDAWIRAQLVTSQIQKRLQSTTSWNRTRVDQLIDLLHEMAALGTSFHPGPQEHQGIAKILENTAHADLLCPALAASNPRLDLSRMNLSRIPKAIFSLESLESLNLAGNRLSSLPPEIKNLTQVRELDLSDNQLTTIPQQIGELGALTRLYLQKNQIQELPESLGSLQALQDLTLYNNQLTALPDTIANLKSLTVLDLNGNQLQELPDAIGELESLEWFRVRKNKLTDLPMTMQNLRSLRGLYLASNPLQGLPDVLLCLGIKEGSGIKGLGRRRRQEDRIKLLRALSKTRLSLDDRKKLFHLYETGKASRSTWFKSLQIKPMQEEAREEIFSWTEDALFDSHLLTEHSVIAILGKTALQKNETRARLKALNIGYSARLTPQVTHIVVGTGPLKDLELLDTQEFAFLEDSLLHDFLDEYEERFLLEKPHSAETLESVEHIRSMLMSPDDDNIILGLELLKSGGAHPDTYSELFALARLHPRRKIKKFARDLLTLHGSTEIKKALASRAPLLSSTHPQEDRTATNFLHYKNKYASLDMTTVALLALQHRQRGLRFLFRFCPNKHEARKKALEMISSEGTLDFSRYYTEEIFHYDSPSSFAHYSPIHFPPEILEMKHVHTLILRGCHLKSIPPEIGTMLSLTYLDVSENHLTEIPSELKNLTSLEILNLSANQFPTFPLVLSQISSLQKLGLGWNHQKGHPHFLEIPSHFSLAQKIDGSARNHTL